MSDPISGMTPKHRAEIGYATFIEPDDGGIVNRVLLTNPSVDDIMKQLMSYGYIPKLKSIHEAIRDRDPDINGFAFDMNKLLKGE